MFCIFLQIILTNFSVIVQSSYESSYPLREESFIVISKPLLDFFLYLFDAAELDASQSLYPKLRTKPIKIRKGKVRVKKDFANVFQCQSCRIRSSVVLMKKHAFPLPSQTFPYQRGLNLFPIMS